MYLSNTTLFDVRDMYRLYYININYMFRPKHVVDLYVVKSVQVSTIKYVHTLNSSLVEA